METDHEPDDQSIVPVQQKPTPNALLLRVSGLVSVSKIVVSSERFRHVSAEDIKTMARSIVLNGLLHPIGVRAYADDSGRFDLMYGKSRLDGFKLANAGDMISATVFEPDTTYDQAKLFEIAENYVRTELTQEERRIHKLEYARLLKKTGAVVSRRKKQGKSKTVRTESEKIDVNPVDDNKSDESETVTEKVSKTFGVSRQALAKDTKKAIEIAQEHGVEINGSATLETMDADKLGEVVEANAKQAAEEKRQLMMTDVLDAAKQVENSKPKKEKIVDPKVMITKMWQTYNGKTVTIDLFRQIVADATEIPGRTGIIKAALDKFDPPVHRQDA